jgi:HTH-type transcriptional regulator/antitoxin HigA
MSVRAQFRLKRRDRNSYLGLIHDLPLASIKSEQHLQEAQHVIDRLLAKGDLDEGETMYLDALSDLVASYEDERHAIGPASDADMLRHLMDAKGVSQMELNRHTGIPKSSISEILAGKKRFSRRTMRVLAEYFRVDVGVLAANL